MHPALSRCLSTLLIDRAGGHRRIVLGNLADLLRRERDASWLEKRNESLADLLRHAQGRVPFYRGLLKGVAITSSNAEATLKRLPIVHRADIQSDPQAFRAEGVEPAASDATGGSTGTPLSFVVDRETQQSRESSLMWSDSMAGWSHGERIAMLWGSDRDVRRATAQSRTRLRWLVDNRRWFNAFDTSEEAMAGWHRDLTSYRPHLIVAYAGTVFLYARFLKARGLRPAYPLRGIVSSAEVLTPAMRAVVESVFPVRVFDRYGNREFGAIAGECEAHDGLHVNPSQMFVEIERADPTAESGPLVITYLQNRAMPFIRYNTGDLAAWHAGGACSCGRMTPRLAPVTGRQSDTIRTASGRLVHGEYFTHLLYGVDGVRQFQFIQEEEDAYCLRVAGDSSSLRALESEWSVRIREMTGPTSRVRFEYVDHIPLLPSGKHKFTLSLVGGA